MSAPAETAACRVREVQDDTRDRVLLARDFYRPGTGDRQRYGRAELRFLRWEIGRGVLAGLYALPAAALREPRVEGLLDRGVPAYSVASGAHEPWRNPVDRRLPRLAARVVGPAHG